MIPIRATYRLQLNKDFTFAHARQVVPYLDELGISHAYLSPILMARPGSTHGYDTVDHTRINPELGSLDSFRDLVAALRDRQMGVLLDFVPNHMGVGGSANPIWLDVLKLGQASPFADWFDIDWQSPRAALRGKVLVPFLGKSYAQCLEEGELALRHDRDGFAVWAHGEHKLPLRAESEQTLLQRYGTLEAATAALSGPSGRAALDAIIGEQHWRAVHYATAGDEINYRRFFVNSDLAGIRVDRPDVFSSSHALILSLIDEGLIDGLRIDHIDGLLDPAGYLNTLREQTPKLSYLYVEKILAPHERLLDSWPVDGTTGYEVGALLTRTLTPASAEQNLNETYHAFVRDTVPLAEETYRCKQRIMDNELAAELGTVSRLTAELAWSVSATADLTEGALRRALREVIAHLAVYRTYIDDSGASNRDRREIHRAVAMARRSRLQDRPTTYDFIERLFCDQLGPEYDPARIAATIGRFQQYCGPVMAKGLEDTALYRYNRLLSLNEVGAHPDRFSVSVAAFHDANIRRIAETPLGMIATSTHDTKRGEDIRAIIGAIADHPGRWSGAVNRWRDMLEDRGVGGISANDLYLFFQLLLGGWPINGDLNHFSERLTAAMTKSAREARINTDWNFPDEGYERKIGDFVRAALECEPFIAQFLSDREPMLETGKRMALAQAILKLTIPGIPDIYRGAEDWEQSFVDPDNRRPLDFISLQTRLGDASAPDRQKIVATQQLLKLRRRLPDLLVGGSYVPADTADAGIAFRRASQGRELLVSVGAGHSFKRSVLGSYGWSTIIDGPEGVVLVRDG